MKLKVVTAATHSNRYFDIYLESAKRNNLDVTVLGMGQKWEGFAWKFNMMKNFLSSCEDNDIVMFTDAYDVFFTRSNDEIIKIFLEIKSTTSAKIIIGNEIINQNIITYAFAEKMFGGQCKGLNLNSGAYIGYAKDLIEILSNMCGGIECDNDMNDQRLMISSCKANPDLFYVDTDNKLFVNFVSAVNKTRFSVKETNGHKYIVMNNGSSPCVIHGPGHTDLTELLQIYGYTDIPKHEKHHSISFLVKSYYKLWYQEIIIFLILLVAFIIYMIYKRQHKKN